MSQNQSLLESLRILLVEDSKTDAILIEKALSQAVPNIQPLHREENIASALKVLGQKIFDVILLDLNLPDTSGLNGLLSIQNMVPDVPVIILTGHSDEELVSKALEHGTQDYLVKDHINGAIITRAMQYAIKRKQFEAARIKQANFDKLTGLPNQLLFESRLDMSMARCKRTKSIVGVFFLDLVRFQQVNDTYGHATGDRVLQQVALRLKNSIRPYDMVSHFAGDAFAIIVDDIRQPEECTITAQRIIKAISATFIIASKQIHIGVSIGISTYSFEDETLSRDDLIEQATEAMHCAKLPNKSEHCFYSAEIREQVARRNQKTD